MCFDATPKICNSDYIYGFNNGSVAPKYAYQGYIVVTLQNIAVKIIQIMI